jgi:hypothetical protein
MKVRSICGKCGNIYTYDQRFMVRCECGKIIDMIGDNADVRVPLEDDET